MTGFEEVGRLMAAAAVVGAEIRQRPDGTVSILAPWLLAKDHYQGPITAAGSLQTACELRARELLKDAAKLQRAVRILQPDDESSEVAT